MLAIAAVLFLGCLAGTICFAVGLYRTIQTSVVASLPVDRPAEITMPSCEMVLEVETPRLSQEYRQLEVQMTEMNTREVTRFAYRPNIFGRESYGVTTMRIPFGRMLAREGNYLLRIEHLRSGVDYSATRLILSRPYMGRMVGYIIALVLCAVGALGSLIWAVSLAGWMQQGA
jgi:hypothetical protein